MPEQNNKCLCGEKGIKTSFCLPLSTCVHIKEGAEGGGERVWESKWFIAYPDLYNKAIDFTHNLNLESPWLCKPSIIHEMPRTGSQWELLSFGVTEYRNSIADAAKVTSGWAISLARNTCRVSCGSGGWFHGWQHRLIIRY